MNIELPTTIDVEDAQSGLVGFLAIHSIRSNLSFGGLRISPTVTRGITAGLAHSMHLKYAAHGLAIGGAKGGIQCAPDDRRLERKIAAFAGKLRVFLSRAVILGKDMGASDHLLDHLYSALGMPQLGLVRARSSGDAVPARVRQLTGYQPHMTGRGVAAAVVAACDHVGRRVAGARVLIQGFGRVGRGAAYHLARRDVNLVGVSDRHGMISSDIGLSVNALLEATNEVGEVDRTRLAPACTLGPRDDLMHTDADVLILAADSFTVDAERARLIEAGLVVEGANMALTPGARDHLCVARKVVIPDIIASSSSAALLGHQFLNGNRLSEDWVWDRIEQRITDNVHRVIEISRAQARPARDAFLADIDEHG